MTLGEPAPAARTTMPRSLVSPDLVGIRRVQPAGEFEP